MSGSETYWVLAARAAGLETALAGFRDDVAAAAAMAAQAAAGLVPPETVRAEPWPPMRVGGGV